MNASTLAATAVGAVFVYAGVAKVLSGSEWPKSAERLGVPKVVALLVMFAEIVIGLGMVLPPEYTIMMWIGSAFFTVMERRYVQRVGEFGHRLWVDGREAVCAGIIAGWALLGVGNGIVEAFVTIPQDAQQAAAMETVAPAAPEVPAAPAAPAPIAPASGG